MSTKILFLYLSICITLMFFLAACSMPNGSKASAVPTETFTPVSEITPTAEDLPEKAETDIQPNRTSATSPVGIENIDMTTRLESDLQEPYNDTLVVYFSHTEKTRPVAEYIHSLVGGDLVRLEPVIPYPAGYHDALDPAKREQLENARPEIKNSIEHFDSYKTIYLGYPIWRWGTTPMLIFTFLEAYDFSGKTVMPFATSGGTGISKSIIDIRSTIPSADVRDGLLVKDNADIIPWLQQMEL